MVDGTILLFKRENKKFDLVGRAIEFFTGSPYTHVALFLNGCTYDATVWTPQGKWWPHSGVRKTVGTLPGYSTLLQPKVPIKHDEMIAMVAVAEDEIKNHVPYNVLKLLVLAIVYPTRKFWTWINWVPFQAEFFGEVCSEFVDEEYSTAGRDLFPGRTEEDTVPGDYMKCDQIEVVNA